MNNIDLKKREQMKLLMVDIAMILFIILSCSKDKKEIINLMRCDENPNIDTAHNNNVLYPIARVDFATPCYKDSTDTIQFQFDLPILTFASLEILDEKENIQQTLINDSLSAGHHEVFWKNTNNEDIIGARFTKNNFSKTYWFIK
jgi:hypothetical protein